MDKVTANSLVKLRAMQRELNDYVSYREKVIKDELLLASTMESVKSLQGRYEEVRRLRTLSDEIEKALKET